MKILHLTATLDPSAGGPAEGVRQGVLALAARGHEVEAACLDAPGAPCLANVGVPVTALGPSHRVYGRTPDVLPWLRAHAVRFDAVIVNGLWQYHGFAAWRALHGSPVPYYVFPHGMLDPWFKRTYPLKHLKKWLYWPWAEYRVLRDARGVLFTTEAERLLARQSFWLYRARECVVSYGTASAPTDAARLRAAFLAAHPALAGCRIVLFLGRIHPKKGCDLLLRAFANLARDVPGAHLVLAGPGTSDTLSALRDDAARSGIGTRVTFTGMLEADLKWGAFYASDAFALPSHQENFGVAVVEALACGLPVLISDKVNIWREVEADGAAIVASDTVDGAEQNLRRWFALDETERARMRRQATTSFQARFTIDAHTQRLLDVLEADAACRERASEALPFVPPKGRQAHG